MTTRTPKPSDPCSTLYKAAKTSGTRPLSDITLIVMHDTEGGSAEGVAGYFTTAAAGGSAHLVVDDTKCYRTLRDEDIPWGAPGANLQGFHIEQCGYAAWSLAVWKRHRETLHRAAYKAAHACLRYNIPPHFVKADGLAAGHQGITTHAEVSKWQAAIGAPGDHSHTDPGPLWPRRRFMRHVHRYYNDAVAAKK